MNILKEAKRLQVCPKDIPAWGSNPARRNLSPQAHAEGPKTEGRIFGESEFLSEADSGDLPPKRVTPTSPDQEGFIRLPPNGAQEWGVSVFPPRRI